MKRVRTLKDIKNDPRVEDVWLEDDGYSNTDQEMDRPSYWIGLHPEYEVAPHGTNSIHVKTIKAACDKLNNDVSMRSSSKEVK